MLADVADVEMPAPPRCGQILLAETATQLEPSNEFNLPAGKVYLQTAFDPESGTRLSSRITRFQSGDVLLLRRVYEPGSGRIIREERPE